MLHPKMIYVGALQKLSLQGVTCLALSDIAVAEAAVQGVPLLDFQEESSEVPIHLISMPFLLFYTFLYNFTHLISIFFSSIILPSTI